VLLVDDNSASQQAMRRIIINAGVLCDVAGNGKEAGRWRFHSRPFLSST